MYDQPVIPLMRALYGHPDAGTIWEQHCDAVIVKRNGVELVGIGPSCYYHKNGSNYELYTWTFST